MADVDWPGSEQIKQERVYPPGPDPIWYCKIGLKPGVNVPMQKGADAPMREAVSMAFYKQTGFSADFIFSGWSAQLTDNELHIVENRNYERQDQETTLELTEDEILVDPVKQVISPEQWKAAVEEIAAKMGMPAREVNSPGEPVQHYYAQPTEEYVKHGHKPVTTYGELASKLGERQRQREYLRKLEDLLKEARQQRDDFYVRAVKAQSSGANFALIQQELAMHESTVAEIKAEIEREKGKIEMDSRKEGFTLQGIDGPTLSNTAHLADVAIDAGEDVLQQDKQTEFMSFPLHQLIRIRYEINEAISKYDGALELVPRQEPTETNFGFYVDGYTLSHDPENIGGVKITAMDGRSETIKTSQLCAFLERRLPEPD